MLSGYPPITKRCFHQRSELMAGAEILSSYRHARMQLRKGLLTLDGYFKGISSASNFRAHPPPSHIVFLVGLSLPSHFGTYRKARKIQRRLSNLKLNSISSELSKLRQLRKHGNRLNEIRFSSVPDQMLSNPSIRVQFDSKRIA